MLPRLLLGAAVASLACLVLAQRHRSAQICRAYRFQHDEAGFDLVADVITREHAVFGTESRMEQRSATALVRTSRRAHEAIVDALLVQRMGVAFPILT